MSGGSLTAARRPAQALALVGFMGSGKTAVGRAAATRLAVPFVDTDALVEAHHGPIAEIFAVHGEQAFRRLEAEEVCAAVERAMASPCVLALGGGAVLSGDVREALRRLPHVVWLTAPADTLWARVQAGAAGVRPLAADEARFRRLLQEREALYASVATDRVANDGRRTASQVAEEVCAVTTRGSGDGPDDREAAS
jgi:shikimate kinase